MSMELNDRKASVLLVVVFAFAALAIVMGWRNPARHNLTVAFLSLVFGLQLLFSLWIFGEALLDPTFRQDLQRRIQFRLRSTGVR